MHLRWLGCWVGIREGAAPSSENALGLLIITKSPHYHPLREDPQNIVLARFPTACYATCMVHLLVGLLVAVLLYVWFVAKPAKQSPDDNGRAPKQSYARPFESFTDPVVAGDGPAAESTGKSLRAPIDRTRGVLDQVKDRNKDEE